MSRNGRWGRLGVGDAAVALSLVLAVSLRAWSQADIEAYDETAYLTSGLRPVTEGGQGFAWAPIYSDFYRLMSVIIRDPITLGVVGRGLATAVLAACVFVALRIHLPRRWAFMGAATVSMLPAIYLTGVSSLAVAFLVLAVSSAFRWRGPVGLLLAAALVWGAAGCRPEMIPIAVVATVLAGVSLVRYVSSSRADRQATLRVVAVAASVTVALGVLVLIHGWPATDGARLWVAFTQHFSWSRSQGGAIPGDPIADYFGEAGNLFEAAVANPSEMLRFTGMNALAAPVAFVDSHLGSITVWGPAGGATLVALAANLIAVTATVVLGRTEIASAAKTQFRSWRATGLIGPVILSALILVAAVPPVVLVEADPGYMLLGAAIIGAGPALLCSRFGRHLTVVRVAPGVVVACFAVFAVGALASAADRVAGAPPPFASMLRAVSAEPEGVAVLVGTDGQGFSVYTDRWIAVTPPARGFATFQDFLDGQGVDAVLLTPPLSSGPWAALPGYVDFVLDPSAYGFVTLTQGSPLLVRTDGVPS